LEDIEWQQPEQFLKDEEEADDRVAAFIKGGSSSNEVK
jgi:hypothetical protein